MSISIVRNDGKMSTMTSSQLVSSAGINPSILDSINGHMGSISSSLKKVSDDTSTMNAFTNMQQLYNSMASDQRSFHEETMNTISKSHANTCCMIESIITRIENLEKNVSLLTLNVNSIYTLSKPSSNNVVKSL